MRAWCGWVGYCYEKHLMIRCFSPRISRAEGGVLFWFVGGFTNVETFTTFSLRIATKFDVENCILFEELCKTCAGIGKEGWNSLSLSLSVCLSLALVWGTFITSFRSLGFTELGSLQAALLVVGSLLHLLSFSHSMYLSVIRKNILKRVILDPQ